MKITIKREQNDACIGIVEREQFRTKFKSIICLAALAMLAAACSEEDNAVQPGNETGGTGEVNMITEIITATNGDANGSTRAAVDDDAKFSWTAGDVIAVHVSNGTNGKYVTTNPLTAGDISEDGADFTVSYEEGYSRDAFAVYPASIVATDAANYGKEDQTLDVTLPSSYTLAEVGGEMTPCPMIATNNAGGVWTFSHLCGLLRLKVTNIPFTAKRLEIDFDGKQVCGDFSIESPVTPGTSVIATTDGADNSVITITKDGTDALLGVADVVLNIPLPTGTYTAINVVAYDAEGAAITVGNVAFNYTASRKKGKKIDVSVTSAPTASFTFTFQNQESNLGNNLRFVRLFSSQNKLHNETTYGPYTVSNTTDMENPVSATLKFDSNNGDQLAFQVVTEDGKVYSGSCDAPAGGFKPGKSYDLTVPVNLYTFTVASGKQVYFSPGDLGVDNGVYSFTEPFTAWNQDQTSMTNKTNPPAKRTWFIKSDVQNGQTVYGIKWRIQDYAKEWKYLVGINDGRTIDGGNVELYYKVHINTTELGDRYWCYLLPPDQTTAGDIEDDLKNFKEGTDYYEVSDYIKYIAKGFVLLMDTEHSYRTSTTGNWKYKSRSDKHSGYYQAGYVSSGKTYFDFGADGPNYNAPGNGTDYRIHTRYIYDVPNE